MTARLRMTGHLRAREGVVRRLTATGVVAVHVLRCSDCEGAGEVEMVAGHPLDPDARAWTETCGGCGGDGVTVNEDHGCPECVSAREMDTTEARAM